MADPFIEEGASLREVRDAALDLLGRGVLDVLPELPQVAERIGDHAPAITPEHVRERRHDGRAGVDRARERRVDVAHVEICLLYTSDAADERSSVDLGGRRII